MATIYEIEQMIDECFDPETGEADIERLEQLEMERNTKIENLGCLVKNLKSDAEAIRNEEKALADRRHTIENRMESCKKYLAYVLHGDKFKSPRLAVSYRKSYPVDIFDETQIAEEYKSYEVKFDKIAIRDALKSGKTVDGAQMLEKSSIQIK